MSLPAFEEKLIELTDAYVSVTEMVLVGDPLRLFDAWPSSACQVMVREVESAVGLFEVLRKVTARKAFWYWAGVPAPERVSTPVVELYVPLIEPIVDPSFVKAKMSPAVLFDVIETVAPARLAVSASLTVMPVKTTPAAAPSVYDS